MIRRRTVVPARTGRPLRPAFGVRDLLNEAVAGMLARPARTLLTVAGTVLGIAALVATLGLSKTAGSQIVGRFDALAATQVTAEPAQNSSIGGAAKPTLPWDVEDRISRLNGVVAVGAYGEVDTGGKAVRAVDIEDRTGQSSAQMHVVAATPGLLSALRGHISTGRWFDQGYSRDQARVVILGAGAAARLNITRIDNQLAVYIGDELYVVIGIVGDVARQPDLLNALWMPLGTAQARFKAQSPSKIVIETAIGAANLIARQTAIALNPNDPTLVRVVSPAEPRRVKQDVQSDVDSLFLLLGVVSLVVGAIGIANVTLVTVMERVGEIGLRRALGATRAHIARQFLVESIVMGFAGGIVGASAGIIVVTGTALSRGWTPVLDLWIPFAAPVLGAFVGLIAGLYPSLRAASLEPVEALRSS
jgi:ABC-type antimicrobial peptide transport system permease subunit